MTPQEAALATTTAISDREYLERDVIVAFAGDAGIKRALRGSAPGWRRRRTPESLRAFHEGSHSVIAAALGQYVASVDITVRMFPDGRRAIGGIARIADTPAQAEALPVLNDAQLFDGDSDLQRAIKNCSVLAPRREWRLILATARALRLESERLVEQYWLEVCRIAAALITHPDGLPAPELEWFSKRFSGESVRPCRLPEAVSA